VNPTDAAKSVEVRLGQGQRLKDVYTGAPLSVRGSMVALALPPLSKTGGMCTRKTDDKCTTLAWDKGRAPLSISDLSRG
jgi:hypothetical protein